MYNQRIVFLSKPHFPVHLQLVRMSRRRETHNKGSARLKQAEENDRSGSLFAMYLQRPGKDDMEGPYVTLSKHIKGSEERYLLGQNTICKFSG